MDETEKYEELRKYFEGLETEKQKDVVVIQKLMNQVKKMKKGEDAKCHYQ